MDANVADLDAGLIFEQDPVQILDALLPLYLSATLLRSLQVWLSSCNILSSLLGIKGRLGLVIEKGLLVYSASVWASSQEVDNPKVFLYTLVSGAWLLTAHALCRSPWPVSLQPE